MSYVFSFTFFFTAAHFHHSCHPLTKFSCCSSNKKIIKKLSLVLDLCRPLSLYSKLEDIINKKIQKIRMYKKCQSMRNISLWSELTPLNLFVVYASQNAGGYSFLRQKTPSQTTPRNFALVCLWCGRTVGRSVYVPVITKFSRMGSLPHFLTHGATLCALRERQLRYNTLVCVSQRISNK